jgi:hypothetical protein
MPKEALKAEEEAAHLAKLDSSYLLITFLIEGFLDTFQE